MPGIRLNRVQLGTNVNQNKKVESFNLVLEGNSLIAKIELNNLLKYFSNTSGFYSSAVDGSSIPQAVARATVVDSKLIAESTTNKNLLIVMLGTNDIYDAGTGLSVYAALKDYVIARTASGWKVVVITCLPSTHTFRGVVWEQERVIFNNQIRTDLALSQNVYVVDTDTEIKFNTTTDTSIFVDLLHLTYVGAQLLHELIESRIVEAYSNLILKQFGVELVPDPEFSDASKWTLGAGAGISISDGLFHYNGSSYAYPWGKATLLQNITGKLVKITVDMPVHISGQPYITMGIGGADTPRFVKGKQVFYITWGGSSILFCLSGSYSTTGAVASITSVSIKEVV